MEVIIRNYISGQTALALRENSYLLRRPAGTPFLEFPAEAWFGENDPEKNTLECLGAFGLQESSAWLRHFGFTAFQNTAYFVADPMRAVLDIVFFVDSMGLKPKPFFSGKYIQAGWQKREILSNAVKMARFYKRRSLYEWIRHEYNNLQKFDIREVLPEDEQYE